MGSGGHCGCCTHCVDRVSRWTGARRKRRIRLAPADVAECNAYARLVHPFTATQSSAGVDRRSHTVWSEPTSSGPHRASILATARRPEQTQALRIALRGNSLRIDVGASEIARVPWPATCPLVVEARGFELRLLGRTFPLQTGTPGEMPIVTGLFSQLDLHTGHRPEIVIRTRDYSTSATAMQVVASAVAVALALLAMCFISGAGRLPRRDRIARTSPANGADAIEPTLLLHSYSSRG